MSSFPSRISRKALGPTYINRRPVRDTKREIGADVFNRAFWQIAGCNATVPLAWALIRGSDGALLAAAEAWDPDALFTPAPLRVSTGVYKLTYAAQYPNHAGQAVTLALFAAAACPQGDDDRRAVARVEANRIVHVRVRDSAGAPVDGDVLAWAF